MVGRGTPLDIAMCAAPCGPPAPTETSGRRRAPGTAEDGLSLGRVGDPKRGRQTLAHYVENEWWEFRTVEQHYPPLHEPPGGGVLDQRMAVLPRKDSFGALAHLLDMKFDVTSTRSPSAATRTLPITRRVFDLGICPCAGPSQAPDPLFQPAAVVPDQRSECGCANASAEVGMKYSHGDAIRRL